MCGFSIREMCYYPSELDGNIRIHFQNGLDSKFGDSRFTWVTHNPVN